MCLSQDRRCRAESVPSSSDRSRYILICKGLSGGESTTTAAATTTKKGKVGVGRKPHEATRGMSLCARHTDGRTAEKEKNGAGRGGGGGGGGVHRVIGIAFPIYVTLDCRSSFYIRH